MPVLADFLSVVRDKNLAVDRGVDSRLVADDLTAEYGWFLLSRTLRRRFGFRPRDKAALESLALTVSKGDPRQRVVMKNPWDVANEAQLLQAFPSSRLILLRRPLPEIEASTRRAFWRRRTDFNYILALFGRSWLGPFWVWCLSGPFRLRAAYVVDVWRIRFRVLRGARNLRRLPLSRVALLDYDELSRSPSQAARWASSLVDADRFAHAFAARLLQSNAPCPTDRSAIAHAIDLYWRREWDRARQKQQKEACAARSGHGAGATKTSGALPCVPAKPGD
jgi:hypothetical protein